MNPNTFHTSGSADITINKNIKNLFENHLEDIIDNNYNQIYTIVFNDNIVTPEIIAEFEKEDLNVFDHETNSISIKYDNQILENNDVITVMRNAKGLLKLIKNNTILPEDYYKMMMGYLLQVGDPYSSFIEMLFTNMFLTNDEPQIFWRYDQNNFPSIKIGDRVLAYKISKLLGILYAPNKKTFQNIKSFEIDYNNLTPHEKLWLGTI